ncbi:Abi family protein [Curtobacterium sp. RRHDQ66]|uniref:Abi family protein n=1 Tax=Curtobacterium guangdongense TaxID=3413380 RepID=UPI003BF1C6A3
MTSFTAHLSPWRTAQFRRALRTFGLPSADRDVDRLHEFDSALRIALLIRIERIELALRGRMAITCAGKFGPSWHVDPRAFRPGVDVDALRAQFSSALDRSTDPATRRISAERDLGQVAFGMVAEHLSLGAISRLAGLLDPRVARELATTFRLPAPTLRGTLQHVTHVRNCCAHHSRIWGTQLGVPTPKYRSPPSLIEPLRRTLPRSPYRSLVIISHMADSVRSDPVRTLALDKLLAEHRDLLIGLGASES